MNTADNFMTPRKEEKEVSTVVTFPIKAYYLTCASMQGTIGILSSEKEEAERGSCSKCTIQKVLITAVK